MRGMRLQINNNYKGKIKEKIMEKARKNLKNLSIVILAFAGLTLIDTVFELLFGSFNNAEIPEGSPDNILLITKIFVAVVALIMLLPQVYIGVKGLKVAKNPDSSRGHIVWGTILFVLTLIGLVSPVLALIRMEDAAANIAQILSVAVDAAIFWYYVKFAKIVSKGN